MSCRLLCKDGEVLEVPVAVASTSELIAGKIKDSGTDEDIPLTRVDKPTMEKVLIFMERMAEHTPPEIEKPLSSTDLSQVVEAWYFDYVNVETEKLFEITLAAEYLNIKPLLELSCAKVASQIKGKSIPEIRQYFSIENDWTPEEEERVMEENRWAEESF